jgi:hypothetical protein
MITATYANCDVLGCGKGPVEEEANKRSVKAIFRSEVGQQRISHTLRHNNEADGDTLSHALVFFFSLRYFDRASTNQQ